MRGMIMKKGKVVLFPMIILSLLIVLSIIVGIVYASNSKRKSVFEFSTVEEIYKEGNKRSVDDSFKFSGIEEFGYIGDGEIDATEEKITCIWFVTNLSEDVSDEKRNLKEIVINFVEAYSKKYGFKIIDEPVKIQYCDEETYKNCPEDDYEALKESYVLFEYSYRDKDGVLWIAQVFAPGNNTLKGLLVKQINDSDFDGFIPQADMRENK